MDKANVSKSEQSYFHYYNVTKLTELTEPKQNSFSKCMSNIYSNIKLNKYSLCTRL